MKQQKYLLARSCRVEEQPSLISRGVIRWRVLTQAERFFCVCIVLTPLWWVIGWAYILPIWLTVVAIYEIRCNGTLDLKTPSLSVISAIAFGLYRAICTSFNSPEVKPSFLLAPIASFCCLGLVIWYCQSKDIRIRIEVVGWAFSILVVQMFLVWIVAQLILGAPYYNPPLSLFGQLTDKAQRFIPGVGNTNYLMPYLPDDKIATGLARFSFFFPGPEALALLVGFMGLLALDLKNRSWSVVLLLGCTFVLFLSATRSNWITFPLILIIRFLIVNSKRVKSWLIFCLIAVVSFLLFSLPPATDFIVNTFINTAESTGNARADSTEVRALIYQRTWEAITNESEDFVFGRGVPGLTVLPGYAPAQVGSHSFLLGTLLYRSGFLGTSIFATFWISLLLWFYQTRKNRPICSFLIILYITITFSVMELESTTPLILILCAALKTNSNPIAGSMLHA